VKQIDAKSGRTEWIARLRLRELAATDPEGERKRHQPAMRRRFRMRACADEARGRVYVSLWANRGARALCAQRRGDCALAGRLASKRNGLARDGRVVRR